MVKACVGRVRDADSSRSELLRGGRAVVGRPHRSPVRHRQQQAASSSHPRRWGVSVAESALAPPGPIPNPVVTRRSAGEYYGGDSMGGEAAAGTPDRRG
jgi:hypothetical protein